MFDAHMALRAIDPEIRRIMLIGGRFFATGMRFGFMAYQAFFVFNKPNVPEPAFMFHVA